MIEIMNRASDKAHDGRPPATEAAKSYYAKIMEREGLQDFSVIKSGKDVSNVKTDRAEPENSGRSVSEGLAGAKRETTSRGSR